MPGGTLSVQIDTRQVEHVLDAALKFSSDPTGRVKPLLRRLLNTLEHDATRAAPVATGVLRRSGRSEFIETASSSAVARVSYGGLAEKYASVQHEHTEFRHTLPEGMDRGKRLSGKSRTHPVIGYRGGQAHWLFGSGTPGWNPARAALWSRLLGEELRHVADRELRP